MSDRPQRLDGHPDPDNTEIAAWVRLIVEDDYWPGHSHREDVVVLPRAFVRALAGGVMSPHNKGER